MLTTEEKALAKEEKERLIAERVTWSADIPLTADGLALNLWGAPCCKTGVPVAVMLKRNQVLLWRGDVIHGGGFSGKVSAEQAEVSKGVRSFRLHLNLMLCKEHIGRCPAANGIICRVDVEGTSLLELYGYPDAKSSEHTYF